MYEKNTFKFIVGFANEKYAVILRVVEDDDNGSIKDWVNDSGTYAEDACLEVPKDIDTSKVYYVEGVVRQVAEDDIEFRGEWKVATPEQLGL